MHWTTRLGALTGHPAALLIVVGYGALWFTFGRETFDWVAVATLAVWCMTLFIQRADRRDTLAVHAKLDELLKVTRDAAPSSRRSTRKSRKTSRRSATAKRARP